MTNWKIADDLVVGWVGVQSLPKLQVFRLRVSEATEEQNGRTNRPEVPVGYVVLMWPSRFILHVRIQELHGGAHVPAIGSGVFPQIVIGRRENLTNRCHGIGIEQRIAVRLGAAQLLWKAAVGGQLIWQ